MWPSKKAPLIYPDKGTGSAPEGPLREFSTFAECKAPFSSQFTSPQPDPPSRPLLICDRCRLPIEPVDRVEYCFQEEPEGKHGEVTVRHTKCVTPFNAVPLRDPTAHSGAIPKVDLG
jgi:hypothetical protein